MTDTPTKPTPAPCYSVARDAWATALRLAGGDRRRLAVIGPDTVLVRNSPPR